MMNSVCAKSSGLRRQPLCRKVEGGASRMHTHSIDEFRHNHDHVGSTEHHEARTRWVVGITATMLARFRSIFRKPFPFFPLPCSVCS